MPHSCRSAEPSIPQILFAEKRVFEAVPLSPASLRFCMLEPSTSYSRKTSLLVLGKFRDGPFQRHSQRWMGLVRELLNWFQFPASSCAISFPSHPPRRKLAVFTRIRNVQVTNVDCPRKLHARCTFRMFPVPHLSLKDPRGFARSHPRPCHGTSVITVEIARQAGRRNGGVIHRRCATTSSPPFCAVSQYVHCCRAPDLH